MEPATAMPQPEPASDRHATEPSEVDPVDHDRAGTSDDEVEITSDAFATRLANLLVHRREEAMLTLAAITRKSDGRFNRRELRRYEAGSGALDAVTVSALADLYRIDLDDLVPARTEISIDDDGMLSTAGVRAAFVPSSPDSLLTTYLRLVRRLRGQERDDAVELRREDVERIASYLEESGERVVEMLGALMGATKTQRRLMAGMFLTGAMVITIAVPSAVALNMSSGSGSDVTDLDGASSTPALTLVADGGGDATDDGIIDPTATDAATIETGDASGAGASDVVPVPSATPGAGNPGGGAGNVSDGTSAEGDDGLDTSDGSADAPPPASSAPTPAPAPATAPPSPPATNDPPPSAPPVQPSPPTTVIDDEAYVETGPPPIPADPSAEIVDPGEDSAQQPSPPPPHGAPLPKVPADSAPGADPISGDPTPGDSLGTDPGGDDSAPEVAVGPPPIPGTSVPIVDS